MMWRLLAVYLWMLEQWDDGYAVHAERCDADVLAWCA